jgi:2-phospho-L-lactate guanylyltransferase
MSCWAVVALKASGEAKGRLAETLSAEERALLARRMFDNVIDALRNANSISDIAVVTPESLEFEHQVTLLKDPGGDLNDAFSHAAQLLTQRGVRELLVLPADLPFLGGAEIDEMVRRGRQSGLAIAPDKQGLGTNAIFVALPTSFRFHFGLHSFGKHLAEAAGHGMVAQRVDLPGLAFDVDEPQDLDLLLEQGGGRYAFLRPAKR